MSKLLRTGTFIISVLIGAVLTSRWWYANPEFFPVSSESFWQFFDRVFGVTNIDEAKNVEFVVVVTVSFLTSILIVMVTRLIFKHLCKKDKN